MLSSCAASVGAWHGHFKQRWPPYRTCQRSFSAALTFFPRCLCLNPLYPYRWRLSPLTSLATGPAWQEVVPLRVSAGEYHRPEISNSSLSRSGGRRLAVYEHCMDHTRSAEFGNRTSINHRLSLRLCQQ